MGNFAALVLYFELIGFVGRRRRGRRTAVEVPARLPATAVGRGCACTFCSQARAA
ncbi:MAG: hypothetical protein M3Y04_02490 [Actinomycetota bacterium]|nr:hypothetical protein [Actinomycetota bacterium]